jgi:hypothetical protein
MFYEKIEFLSKNTFLTALVMVFWLITYFKSWECGIESRSVETAGAESVRGVDLFLF